MTATLPQQKNVTRRSRSIPLRLLREGAVHWIPAYYLLRLSDLGREGLEHSGSFRFADHIYQGTPSGRTVIGRWIDGRLLAMRPARAFRRRCERSREVIERALTSHPVGTERLRVLGVPCGIPRDILDFAKAEAANASLLSRLEYHGLDIDPEVLDVARELTRDCGLTAMHYHVGNALVAGDYPNERFHVVVSTGLGEFLDDEELAMFFRTIFERLESGGTFYTSASAKEGRSDTLLRMAEIVAHYRQPEELARILKSLPWKCVALSRDDTGLQTFATAIKS